MKKKSHKSSKALPKGWTAKRVRALAEFYDNQAEDEAVAEDEAAWNDPNITMMAIPVALVPKVQKLISRKVG